MPERGIPIFKGIALQLAGGGRLPAHKLLEHSAVRSVYTMIPLANIYMMLLGQFEHEIPVIANLLLLGYTVCHIW